MGFSYNGSKASPERTRMRQPKRVRGNLNQARPYQAPTSPLYTIYTQQTVQRLISSAWTYASTSNTQISLTFGSTYWVDMVGIFVSSTNGNEYMTVSINGGYPYILENEDDAAGLVKNGSPGKLYPDTAGWVFDVYGYGLSFQATVNNSRNMYVGPNMPQTHCTKSGQIVTAAGNTVTNIYAYREAGYY